MKSRPTAEITIVGYRWAECQDCHRSDSMVFVLDTFEPRELTHLRRGREQFCEYCIRRFIANFNFEELDADDEDISVE